MRKAFLVVVALFAVAMIISLAVGQVASAAVTWCADDLGPMSTTAEQHISGQGASIQGNHIVAVPVQAVSVLKGGTNPNK